LTKKTEPFEGLTLATKLTHLVDFYGWDGLAERIPVRCFQMNPSMTSSLNFIRRTDWAREKLEALYEESVKRYG
jgi:uncharacterized protein (DUF2132 family)